jgi:hypothetical protein
MTMKASSVRVLVTVGVLMTTFAAMANAATTVLDPGRGTDYLQSRELRGQASP